MITDLNGYRSNIIPQILNHIKLPLEGQDLYEFGVASGKSMAEILNALKKYNVSFNTFHGFDSFIGMPNCDKEPLWQECWAEGNFSSQSEYLCDTVEDTIDTLKANLSPYLYESTQSINLVPGFYEESLAKINPATLLPAAILDIDCDLYSSTYTALDFMAKNNLIRTGTLIIYDDWGGSPGFKTNSDGESRAHKEIFDRYNLKADCILTHGSEFPHVQTFFIVK